MKHLVLIICLLFPYVLNAQEQIKMEKSGGIYKIPCEVNGLRMKFYFDTGASLVSISLKEAIFMLENDYLTPKDIIGTGKSTIADGRIVDNSIINIRELKIGSKTLRNVKASVSNSLMAPILLGQSALKMLGEYKIQGDYLILSRTNASELNIDAVREKAYKSYKDGIWLVAASEYEKIERAGLTTSMDLMRYGICCMENKENEKAISLLSKVDDSELDDSAKVQKYHVLSSAYGYIGDEYNCCLHAQNAYLIFKDKKVSIMGRLSLMFYYQNNKETLVKARDLCNVLLNEYAGNSYDNLSSYYGGKDDLLDYLIGNKYYLMCCIAYESQNFDYYGITLKNLINLSNKDNQLARSYVEKMRIHEVFHPCTRCNGTGRCYMCEGSGSRPYGTCFLCNGTGNCGQCYGKRGETIIEQY